MDNVKLEMGKLLEENFRTPLIEGKDGYTNGVADALVSQATSSITALIIKWLEGKKYQLHPDEGIFLQGKLVGHNQLITELVEDVR